MPDEVRAVLLAGGEGRRMGRLGQGRLKPLIPFGGSCRLIDFSLANAAASSLPLVVLLSQYEERRLMDDLRRTWWRRDFRVHFGPWDEWYRDGVPGPLPGSDAPPERGTADALIRKARYIFEPGVRDVLVQHSDHVYRFDYRPMIAQHRASGASLTLAYQRIDPRYVHLFGMVELDSVGRLTRFVEKPSIVTSDLVFSAFCLFDAAVLHRYLEQLDGTDWQHDISRDVIPAMLAAGERIEGYPVQGYWADIGTVERYHSAHLGMVDPSVAARPDLDTMPRTVAPAVSRALVRDGSGVRRSVVPVGLVNAGLVEESVVFPGARVGAGAHVTRSVLLPGAQVAAGARLDSVIVCEDGFVQGVPPPPVVTGAGR
ncbi:sugar phosphate nucleotidyltransferase [Micromonospora sp. M61]|uniref:sugar phosphate nucleotidyltransferase n=1 Tax=Micromonospora sp. M61 TaxID=2824890 RepID=UPI001B381856|nr:sugar phosphate nucleotidyltransferase [Micromonospora sp. M61]MBQ0977939.1 NTP transferase domain-containing protein [Micromonospora sp. M61]